MATPKERPELAAGSGMTAAPASSAEAQGAAGERWPEQWPERLRDWFAIEASPYFVSMIVHAVVFLGLGLTLGYQQLAQAGPAAATLFDAVPLVDEPERESEIQITTFVPLPDDPPNEPLPKIDVDNPGQTPGPVIHDGGDDPLPGENPGGLLTGANGNTPDARNSIDFTGLGGGPRSAPVPGGPGTDDKPGRGGIGSRDLRDGGRFGSPRTCVSAVNAALAWLARHQHRDGSWSIDRFHENCQKTRCSGAGSSKSDSGATALGLLPFLGAGITHQPTDKQAGKNKQRYTQAVVGGLTWLLAHQKPDGDLSAGSSHVMYSHGLATIALCEAYAMTNDSRWRQPAQLAVRFIENAQNKQDGGWRYRPGEPGDTSVGGWQLMALKSAQMAKLEVNPATFANYERWLTSVARGDYGSQFGYMPQRPGTVPTMTAVGLLCREYLGAPKGDPALNAGIDYLLKNAPASNEQRNVYYWYYASQVLHHMRDERWDQWNRRVRKLLVDSQVKGTGCDAGSWDPKLPTPDPWGGAGGRLLQTSLSCLTLEVYYRHLPLYR